MTHLCYVYIYKYSNLSNIELCIDPHYKYDYNPVKNELKITSQNVLPEDFWGNGIYSLTGIFGNNGAGKTNSIRFLLEAVVHGSNINIGNGFVVYKDKNELKIHCHNIEKVPTFTIDNCIKQDSMPDSIQDMNPFFYSGCFNPNSSYDDMTTNQFGDMYNASIGFRLKDDFEQYSNVDRDSNRSINTYMESYISQNNYRICKLLTDDGLRVKIKNFKIPRYILFFPNRGGYNRFKYDATVSQTVRGAIGAYIDRNINVNDIDEQIFAQFIHHCLLNCLADNLNFSDSNLLRNWYSVFNPEDKLLPQFKSFVENEQSNEVRECLYKVFDVLTRLHDYSHNMSGVLYLDLENEIDREKIFELMELAQNNNIFLTARFFDMYYSHEINRETLSSSGEQELLNLFSLINYAVNIRPNKYDKDKVPQLLVLDEAELGFHPEWQRNYISMLVDFVNSMSNEHKFQIILTSHSPILLSDIPLCCCNYLKYDEEKKITYNVGNKQHNTFASNVFYLYRDSFFLENGLIGCFAENKLNKLKEEIEKGTRSANGCQEYVEQMINLIGDKRLQMYFRILLEKSLEKNPKSLIAYYEDKIEKLRKKEKNE